MKWSNGEFFFGPERHVSDPHSHIIGKFKCSSGRFLAWIPVQTNCCSHGRGRPLDLPHFVGLSQIGHARSRRLHAQEKTHFLSREGASSG